MEADAKIAKTCRKSTGICIDKIDSCDELVPHVLKVAIGSIGADKTSRTHTCLAGNHVCLIKIVLRLSDFL